MSLRQRYKPAFIESLYTYPYVTIAMKQAAKALEPDIDLKDSAQIWNLFFGKCRWIHPGNRMTSLLSDPRYLQKVVSMIDQVKDCMTEEMKEIRGIDPTRERSTSHQSRDMWLASCSDDLAELDFWKEIYTDLIAQAKRNQSQLGNV